jgi:hypothetical protein
VTVERVAFEGFEGVRLENGSGAVVMSISAGPRILGLVGQVGNLLAILPDAGIDRPGGARYRFLGGHRLWAAPEIPEVTYQPDERPCTVTEVEQGVRVEAPPDGAGLVKVMEVQPTPGGWVVDHALRNESAGPMTIAPWAITQFPLGGEMIMPTAAKGDGPQANRSLVLWPYTNLGDPRIRFDRDTVRIDAARGGSPLKLGAAPSLGWTAYRVQSAVFKKHVAVDGGATYADQGAAVQVYLCDEFCELETLGPVRTVEPGGSATHRERWVLSREHPDGGDPA